LRGDQTWAVSPSGRSGTARESLVAQWDLSSTKTNIGTAFVDIYTQTNSDCKRVQIDTNGKTQVRLIVIWDRIGTSTNSVQMLEVGTSNMLISMDVVSGLNTSALTNIPAFATNSVKFYKPSQEHNRHRLSRI